ncbi:alpha-2,8-polysialyltransferase family protein [Isoptericola sp. S6320L]|uniref:alpha-2,8-polysialyltransferase family protein n=1 Tax=Isoptericola sp. S6320L TaxID=2926411 RepID=UPI001FF56ADE|nr:alpha-2,8-polysialyltransferase family protein [Isoptericola sp. S6320L]MCK0117828.1 alpha-2,8-polysialyltransferase family protein [Isoptericola sp. S6320L]
MSARAVTQIVVASTLFSAVGAAAAVDSGLLGSPQRRYWLTVNNAVAPELVSAPHEIAGAEAVARRFDGVLTLSDVVAPTHPSQWSPRDQDLPALERLFRAYWGLGDDRIELVLESIAVNPAKALARVFDSASIVVHSEGLMSYGPTRDPVPWRIARRIDRMVHIDLVPGLVPRLLAEHGVRSTPVPAAAVRAVFEDVSGGSTTDVAGPRADGDEGAPTALVLGQYLSAIGLMTRTEEGELHAAMVRRAAERGVRHVVFKPHPSAPPVVVETMATAARDVGASLQVLDDDRPAEVLIAGLNPALVVGCFSTALITARTIYQIPVLAVGTASVLKRLAPMQNSNRVPLAIVDALLSRDEPVQDPHELQRLVDSVAYAMQPESLHHLRAEVVDTLSLMSRRDLRRYHRMYRLRDLGLPGPKPVPDAAPSAPPASRRHPLLSRMRRRLLPR